MDVLIFSSLTTRYFEPEQYNEQGYQTPITMSTSQVSTNKEDVVFLQQRISKSEVSVYDFKLLDTSAISTVDLGTNHYNYAIESENKHSEPSSTDVRVFVQAY